MKTRRIIVALLVASTVGVTVTAANAGGTPDPSDGWVQVAQGVFERNDNEGNLYRQAIGRAGAEADLKMLRSELAQHDRLGDVSLQYIQRLRGAIEAISEYVASDQGFLPFSQYAWSDTAAVFCGFAGHLSADAWHLSNPGGGPGGATSSATYANLTANSAIPTASFYVSASTTPYGGSSTSVNGSSSISYSSPRGSAFLLTRTTGDVGAAFSNSFTTYSTMSVAGCSGGYQSFQRVGTAN